MSAAPNPALQARLQELRSRFEHTLPERLAAIAVRLGQLSLEPTRGDWLAELTRDFHSMAGTAGSFGLVEVSAITLAAEEVCNRVDGRIDDQALDALMALISRATDVTRRALPA